MHDSDFAMWMNYHGGLFPRFAERLMANQPAIEAYQRAFAAYDFQEAKAASLDLWETNPAIAYHTHGAELKQRLEERTRADSQGNLESLTGCGTCCGGLVCIVAREGQFKSAGVYPLGKNIKRDTTPDTRNPIPAGTLISVACDCPLGQAVRVKRDLPTISDEMMRWAGDVTDGDLAIAIDSSPAELVVQYARLLPRVRDLVNCEKTRREITKDRAKQMEELSERYEQDMG